ncbi:MAG: cobalamin biosynthesis protein [Actinobacteria bacterium]|nr:cobalamin biosynthesis protein [Actinomycetota bacterium]
MSLQHLRDLLVDTDSVAGLAVTTLAIVFVAAGVRLLAVPLVRRRYADDQYRRYWSAKVVTYVIVAVALVALLLAPTLAAAGDPRRGHPVAGFGRAAQALERRVWRDDRLAGAAFVAALVGVPAACTWAIDRRVASGWGRVALRAGVTWAALGGRSLRREASGIAAALGRDDLAQARRRLPALVGRDPWKLDAGEISRAVVESVAENTSDAVVAPLVWGSLAGPAAIVAYRCANTLDAMVGHRSARYQRFGWAAARLDDVLNWLPARLGAAVTGAVAPAVDGSPRAAWSAAVRDGGNHPSPNAGRMEAAFAGALSVRLGGTNVYGDRVEVRGPLGGGASPDATTITRAVRLSKVVGAAVAVLALVGSLAGMSLLLARDALPGDALYGFKRTAEAASLGLTFGDESKALKHLEVPTADPSLNRLFRPPARLRRQARTPTDGGCKAACWTSPMRCAVPGCRWRSATGWTPCARPPRSTCCRAGNCTRRSPRRW